MVTTTRVLDPPTATMAGFGWLEMSSAADAQAVIAEWNGQALDGRTLKVNEAEDRQRGGGGGGGGRGGRGGGGGGGGWGRGGGGY